MRYSHYLLMTVAVQFLGCAGSATSALPETMHVAADGAGGAGAAAGAGGASGAAGSDKNVPSGTSAGGHDPKAIGGQPASRWWDPSLAAEPPRAPILFVGRSPSGNLLDECLFRLVPGAAPKALFCPEPTHASFHSPDRVGLGVIEVPVPGQTDIIVEARERVTDIYPSVLYRVNLSDGSATILDKWDAHPMDGEQRELRGIARLDDGRYVALIERDLKPAIFVASEKIGWGEGVAVSGVLSTLLGVLSDGRVAVMTSNEQGGITLVETSKSVPEIASRIPSMTATDVAPDGSAVVFFNRPFDGPMTLGTVGVGAPGKHSTAGGLVNAGFVDAQTVLVSAESHFLWKPSTDAWSVVASTAIGIPRGSYRRVAGALSFVVGDKQVGWFRDGAFAPSCAASEPIRTLEAVDADLAPVVLFDHYDESASASTVYSCRPGGSPVDLLAAHGMKGRILTPSRPFYD